MLINSSLPASDAEIEIVEHTMIGLKSLSKEK